MLSLFIVLFSFSSSLSTKCLFLNDEPCMVGPTRIDFNPVELKYYPFLISLNECSGSCNNLSPKEIKDINFEAFNIITNKNKAKVMTQHILCHCKCKLNSTICNSNQKWNNETCQCEFKNYRTCRNDYIWNPSTCISENSKYSKSIADTSVTEWD